MTDEQEHEFAPERWVRNRQTGIVESVGDATLDVLLERTFVVDEETGDEEPLYEEISDPARAGMGGGGSWERYEGEDGWYVRPAGSTAGDNALGPYKSAAGATRGVKRRYPNAVVTDAPPPDATELAATSESGSSDEE